MTDTLKAGFRKVDIDGAMRRLAAALVALVALSVPVAALAVEPPPQPPPPPPPSDGSVPAPATQPAPAEPAPTQEAPPPSGPADGATSWAKKEIAAVVAAGLLAPSVAEFRPTDSLTRAELAEAIAALGGTFAVGANPARVVKLRELDTALVRLLGLQKTAKQFRAVLVSAGLAPKGFAGTEVVARLLGLRLNHPESDDRIELLPGDPVTRAETAYSLAQVLALRGSGAVEGVASQAAAFSLPELSEWQRAVLRRAVRFVGWPYIWGGSSESQQAPFGTTVPGGFDCSGFVWRVYKLEPFEGAPQLAATLRGRTTYTMSGEVGPNLRLAFDALQPADVVFFGSQGPSSKPGQVGHMGIYLGNGWFVHSSSRGTTIAPLEDWYAESFAWARRPLAEVNLS